MLHVLAAVARGGLVLPTLALGAGLLFPDLARGTQPLLPFAVVSIVMINVLLAEPERAGRRELLAVALLIGLTLLGMPLLVQAVVGAAALPELLCWVAFAVATPVGSTAIIAAAALGQATRPLVLAQLGAVLALPLSLPVLAAVVCSAESAIDGGALFLRAAALVLGPAAVAVALRPLLGPRRARLQPSLRGVSVLALTAIAFLQGGTLPAALATVSPADGQVVLLATIAALAVSGVLAAAAGRLLGAGQSLTFGIGGACRNISLVWAATAPWLPPAGLLSLMIALVLTFVLPATVAAARGIVGAVHRAGIRSRALA